MSRRPDLRSTTPGPPPERAAKIRAQLERVLSSPQFRGSKRCQALLRHITEQTLVGQTASLKERTLGVEVFGRQPDYDTNQDPVVRATAAETRKKLAQYYQEAAHDSEPRIDLLSGSYVVDFPSGGAVAVAGKSGGRRRLRLAAAVAVPVVLALALALAWPRWTRSHLDRLWAPVLDAPGTILICIGQPIAYNLRSARAQDAIQGLGAPPPGEPADGEVIPRKELIILWDRYVALGDAVCLVHLTSLFERHGKPFRIRGERSTTFADLRDNPAVLIAAFDNQWTLRAAGQLRFTFAKDAATDTEMVRDQQHPENTSWKLTGAWPHWDVSKDYAIVSRVLDTTTDRPIVIAAGITQYGTIAAGEFLTNPAYFAEAVPKLPRGWENRNLQIVLSVPVVHRVSGHPAILATHVW